MTDKSFRQQFREARDRHQPSREDRMARDIWWPGHNKDLTLWITFVVFLFVILPLGAYHMAKSDRQSSIEAMDEAIAEQEFRDHARYCSAQLQVSDGVGIQRIIDLNLPGNAFDCARWAIKHLTHYQRELILLSKQERAQ